MSRPNPTLYQVSPEDMNLSGEEVALFNLLLATWQRHLSGNVRNEAYYHGKVRPVTTSGDMPRELRRLGVVVGWGAKAVDALAARSVFTGFTGGAADDLNGALGEIDMEELYQQAVTSELTDSCSFITVSKGLEGEPDVIVSAHSALDAAAIWDERRKRVRAGISVVDVAEDENGYRVPTWVNMYTDDRTYSCRRARGGKWVAEAADNPLRRPLMEPLRYRPSLARPFGRSRITRTVRSLIDRAMCVASRTEVSAVFYTWPQRYLLGVDRKTAEKMAKTKIEAYVDSLMLVSTNRNGDVPQYGQLSQMTMQPHIDHLEMLAKQFASEASIPLDEVGIVFDNPSSADAMYAAQQRLIVEAEGVNRANRPRGAQRFRPGDPGALREPDEAVDGGEGRLRGEARERGPLVPQDRPVLDRPRVRPAAGARHEAGRDAGRRDEHHNPAGGAAGRADTGAGAAGRLAGRRG